MQGLADGYFVLPYTIQSYLSDQIRVPRFSTDSPEFEEAEKGVNARIDRLMSIKGTHSVDYFHKKLGHIMWDFVGMAREAEGLKKAIGLLKELKREFWSDVRIPGEKNSLNVELRRRSVWPILSRLRADGSRCARQGRIVRWTLPRRTSDRGGRSLAS